MLAWLSENYITIIICIAIAALVALVIRYLLKQRKQGGSCGGSCVGCPMSGKCHAVKIENKAPAPSPDADGHKTLDK